MIFLNLYVHIHTNKYVLKYNINELIILLLNFIFFHFLVKKKISSFKKILLRDGSINLIHYNFVPGFNQKCSMLNVYFVQVLFKSF